MKSLRSKETQPLLLHKSVDQIENLEGIQTDFYSDRG